MENKQETPTGAGRETDIFEVDHKDEKMQYALEKAQHTLGYFQSSLLDPKPNQSRFALKARLRDHTTTEHIWLSEVSYDPDGLYYGTISNPPVHLTNVEVGSRIGIAAEDSSDWLVVEDGSLIGGYTIRMYRDGLSPENRARFDREMGLVIDEGEDHFPHDMTTPEGAILCLEDAYTAGDLEAAIACKDFATEVRLMLKDQPDLPQVDKMVAEMTEILEMSFRAHMQEQGMPDFTGVRHVFPRREELENGALLVTEVCLFPDGRRTEDQLLVFQLGNEWRVGPPANDLEEAVD